MQRPVIYVEIKPMEEDDKYYMSWKVGFEGLDFKYEAFSMEEECHNLNELENIAMWITYNNEEDNLCWELAVEELHKIYSDESEKQ